MERDALGVPGGPSVRVAVSGASAARAAEAAAAMAASGCPLILSVGLAGGLDPALATGTLVVPDVVVGEDAVAVALDPQVGARLRARLGGGVASGRLLGLDRVAAGPGEKRALAARHDAVAVDMESHAVARAAAACGARAGVLRVIGDEAATALPRLAAEAVGADGRPRIGRVLTGLVHRPGDLPALLRAGRDSRRALAALARAAPALVALLDERP
ncbi:MAG: adenosylhopane nucleosidase [Paracoccaceae bacterium]